MLPMNLPLLLANPEMRNPENHKARIVQKVMKGNLHLGTILKELSYYWKIRIWFKQPVTIVSRHQHVVTSCRVFSRFCEAAAGGLLYMTSRRTGQYFDHLLKSVDRYELVITHGHERQGPHAFTLERFKAKFDHRFITEEKIAELYGQNSGQTGKPYAPSDFRRISREGSTAVERFLRNFHGLNSTDKTGYIQTGEGKDARWDLSGRRDSWSRNMHFGRDIKVEHMLGNDFIWYSSEFPGCGNGSYGMLATEKTWLHLEDD
jgi:hypothetical protein